MNIETKYHGTLAIAAADLLTFDSGLPGFEDEKQFVLLDFPDNHVFHALQSTRTPDIAFVVTDPFSFFPDYEIKIDDSTVDALGIENEADVTLLSILTVRDPFEDTTVNLQAPVVINRSTKRGRQLILTGTSFETRHHLFQPKEA